MSLCYKDKTFCQSDCVNFECHRYYDGGVAKDAAEFGLPVALSDFSKTCEHYTKPKRENHE